MTLVEPPESAAVTRSGRRGRRPASRAGELRQPAVGLLGLVLVIPIAVALAIGAGGDGSVRLLAPIVTYGLPILAMIAFWWEDWPGTRLRASWSGWADTALIVVGAVLLTGVGQALAGGIDPVGVFDPSPGPGHVPTFPATMPLAGTAFVAMLQLTLVGEGWPLRRIRPVVAGPLAVAVSWAVALVVYLSLVEVEPPTGSEVLARHGPVPGAELGAALVLIGAWQVLCFVTWKGWPFATIANRAVRLSNAHVAVLGGGVLTYVIARRLLGLDPARISAVAGCFIAAGLVFGMLFEDWLSDRAPGVRRATLLAGTLVLSAALMAVLTAVAGVLRLTHVSADDWVEHASLDALATSVILHVAVGRRWPFLPVGRTSS
jgi:hypothetical protein